MVEQPEIERIIRDHFSLSDYRISRMEFYRIENCSDSSELRDVHGMAIPGLAGNGQIFYVDIMPLANLGHAFLYILSGEEGKNVKYVTHDWPPEERFERKRLYPQAQNKQVR